MQDPKEPWKQEMAVHWSLRNEIEPPLYHRTICDIRGISYSSVTISIGFIETVS